MPDSYTPDTTITVTLDSELLNEVQSILDEIGIDMETAIVMYLEEIARKKRNPFEVSVTAYRNFSIPFQPQSCQTVQQALLWCTVPLHCL